MSYNTLGKYFCVTSYGESHGKEIGVIVDGCPAGLTLDLEQIQSDLDRRKPGQSDLTTSRKENDDFEIVSGLFNGITTGSPILIRIQNKDSRSADYTDLESIYRPSHADETYDLKYGIRDHRGGGRASARITAGWVAAGAIAKQIIQMEHPTVFRAYVKQVGKVIDETPIQNIDWSVVEQNPVRSQSIEIATLMQEQISLAKVEKDSLGGVIRGAILNPIAGIGEPVFGKLNAQLGNALLSINAVKGVSFGGGFDMVSKRGSEVNDAWDSEGSKSNNSGGIQGGISNGETIYFDVAFKPTASIGQIQKVKNKDGEIQDLEIQGRHDPCVLPRAAPIVEAMASLVYLDLLLAMNNK